MSYMALSKSIITTLIQAELLKSLKAKLLMRERERELKKYLYEIGVHKQ